MREVSDHSLKEQFVAENCNFIAFCITSWHLLGVRAFLQYLHEHNVDVKGFICISAHKDSGYVLNENSVQFYEGVEYIKLIASTKNVVSKAAGQVSDFLTIDRIRTRGLEKVYIVSPWRPNFEWCAYLSKVMKGKEIQAVVVDEGLAEYIDEKDKNVHSYNRISVSAAYHYFKDKYFKSKLETIMTERGFVTQFSLLKTNSSADVTKTGRYIENEFAIQYYKKSLQTDSVVDEHKLHAYASAVIINTQPFIEAGELLTENDLKLLTEVVKIFSKEGTRVVLKPHPRETNVGRYQVLAAEGNCVIDTDNKVSQESILSQLKEKPKAIIGFTSTTLLTAKLFYDIETVSLVNCMDRSDFADFQQPTIYNFTESFRHVIHCIENVNELLEIVK